jgi:hypothetical protein
MFSSTGSSRTRGSRSPPVASHPRLATGGAEGTAPGCSRRPGQLGLRDRRPNNDFHSTLSTSRRISDP